MVFLTRRALDSLPGIFLLIRLVAANEGRDAVHITTRNVAVYVQKIVRFIFALIVDFQECLHFLPSEGDRGTKMQENRGLTEKQLRSR